MEENKKYYITTPIYYPSGDFHVGTCYCTIMADTLARYKRLRGYDVFFMTGTDEHGQKIQEKANAQGITPKEFVDEFVRRAKDLWKVLDISYDKYMRTTDDYHVKAVQKIFEKILEKGDIYKGEYKGLYCTPCESFWTPTQLVDGKCPDCGREVKEVSEEAYLFELSKYEDTNGSFPKINDVSVVGRKSEVHHRKRTALFERRKNECICQFCYAPISYLSI